MPSEIPNLEFVQNLMSNLQESLKRNARDVFEEQGQQIADEFLEELRSRILRQTFGHTPLNTSYLISKIKHNLDPRILMATGEYLNSFTTERVEDTSGNDVVYRCGVSAGTHSSGISYQLLARVHEYGSPRRRIPARPHWRPTGRDFMSRSAEYARNIRSEIAERVQADLGLGSEA